MNITVMLMMAANRKVKRKTSKTKLQKREKNSERERGKVARKEYGKME